MAKNAPQQNGHGIQNARASTSDERFTDLADGRLARVQMIKEDDPKNARFAANDPRYESEPSDESTPSASSSAIHDVKNEIRQIFADAGEEFDDEDIEQLKIGKPAPPHFPILIVMLAVIKDVTDVVGNILVIGIPITMTTSFFISVILFFWVLGKASGGRWKKKMIRRLWVQYVIATLIKIIPFVQIIPAETIFVLLAHFREAKAVKLLNIAFIRLRFTKKS